MEFGSRRARRAEGSRGVIDEIDEYCEEYVGILDGCSGAVQR